MPSSSSVDQAAEIYITGLRNQHAVENQAIELLERQVGRLENYPEMRDRMQRHIEEAASRPGAWRSCWPIMARVTRLSRTP
jgi:ferritin-like metal-binding protein YciE